MADFSCDIKSPCQDPSTPFINTTAEAPDKSIFLARNTGFGPSYPPLGQNWTQLGCTVYCESTVSQDDADQCAANNWMQCIADKWPPLPPLPPIANRFGQQVPNPSPRHIYQSAAQTVNLTCPDGLPFVYTLPAGKFSGFSQVMADAEALSYAQQTAPSHIVCVSALTPAFVCVNEAYAGSVTASGGQLTAANACWEVLGTYPAGLTTDLDASLGCVTGNLTFHFSGVPNTPGVYNFAVKVSDGQGDYMVKPVTITVVAITNTGFPDGTPGTSYSQNVDSIGVKNPIYSIEGGALPDGLLLDSGGIIYGTPTLAGDFGFVLGVTEAGTGRMCTAAYSIKVAGGLFSQLVWNNPPDQSVANNTDTTGTQVNSGATWALGVQAISQPAGSANNPGNTAKLTYTGPQVNCNLSVDVTQLTKPSGPSHSSHLEILVFVDSSVDGNLLTVDLLSDFFNDTINLGVTDFPFVIPASTGAIITVNYQGGMQHFGGDNLVSMTHSDTLTP